MIKQYASANAFRAALEDRIKNISKKQGTDIQRLRRQVAFDRLLCRLFKKNPGDLFLKGGYSMELRVHMARTTKDIDLVLKARKIADHAAQDQEILDILQEAVREDLKDFFVFFVGTRTAELEAVPYGGSRFPVEAHMDGRLFVRFPIDVVVSSLVLEPVEQLDGCDWLGFAGIETTPFKTISSEQQFAEKFHAYTLPREDDENSRVKDVVDMLLLIETGKLRGDVLKMAIQKVFEYRKTHPPPSGIYVPPASWEPVFDRLRMECNLKVAFRDAISEIASYLQMPVINKQ